MRRLIIILLAVTTLVCGTAARAKAEQLYAIAGGRDLVSFDSATPGTAVARFIGGLPGGGDNALQGIDFRPANGLLYGIDGRQVYTINPLTATATFVSTLTIPVSDPASIDFDPIEDRLRVVTQSGQNLRVNVDTGEVVMDGSINPVNPRIWGVAYTNNFVGATSTTLYGIGTATDSLYTINPATGTITLVGGLDVEAADFVVGFDISGVSDVAYATLRPLGSSSLLYTINLATGQATLMGQIGVGFGFSSINGITAAPAGGGSAIPEPATLVLVGTGLLGVSAAVRNRRQASNSLERRVCPKGF